MRLAIQPAVREADKERSSRVTLQRDYSPIGPSSHGCQVRSSIPTAL